MVVAGIYAGIYAVGAVVFCLLTSGSVQPWANEQHGTGRSQEHDQTGSSGWSQRVCVDCRPKSQFNGELPNVGQENLYMQMLSPYFELERTAGKKKYAENSPVCRPQSQSNRELPTADKESLYMQMLSAAYLKSPVYDINRWLYTADSMKLYIANSTTQLERRSGGWSARICGLWCYIQMAAENDSTELCAYFVSRHSLYCKTKIKNVVVVNIIIIIIYFGHKAYTINNEI